MSIATSFYLFAPAYIANSTPILLLLIPAIRRHNRPIWESKLGHHKTWAGLIGGTIAAILTSIVQFGVRDSSLVSDIALLYSTLPHSILVGFLLGFGALGGDAAKSFFKRRLGIHPGEPLPVIDGIDYVLGSLILLSPLYIPPVTDIIILLLISPVLNLIANTFSYTLGWKKTWY